MRVLDRAWMLRLVLCAYKRHHRCAKTGTTIASSTPHMNVGEIFFVALCSDFPYIEEQCGYEKSWEILPQIALEDEVLSPKEQLWVYGGTVRSLFPGAWDKFA